MSAVQQAVPNRLQGKVAIITGAGSGQGRATAIRLAAEGAAVTVGDIVEDAAQATAETITSQGGNAIAVVADVSKQDAVQAMVDRTVEAFGGVDILHNNAALLSNDVLQRDTKIVGFDQDVFDRSVAVNMLGPLYCCSAAIPEILKRGGGSVVNTSSISGYRGMRALPIYAMTKAAVGILTNYVCVEYGKQGIRCNTVVPGTIMTPAWEVYNDTQEKRDRAMAAVLTQNLGTPEDIAAVVAFLVSDDSKFISAQTITVDGGRLSFV
jgi:NAD(P)-dependent dehydrogenase (short-subunit alcohol dehydrogenase family)